MAPAERKPSQQAYGQSLVTEKGAFGLVKGHRNRPLAVDPNSGALYVGVGSSGNIGVEPPVKATIQRFERDQTTHASGLRNPTGLAIEPRTGDLYAVVQERDGLGDGLVPDYLTRIEKGAFYGWPYAYIGPNPQPGFAKQAPEKVKAAVVPDLLFESHSSALDLVFYDGQQFPEDYRGDAFVALKGSWNRSDPTGYKVVRVPFKDGRPEGGYENFVTGFWVSGSERAEVWGRPVALADQARARSSPTAAGRSGVSPMRVRHGAKPRSEPPRRWRRRRPFGDLLHASAGLLWQVSARRPGQPEPRALCGASTMASSERGKAGKFVYLFGNGRADGSAQLTDLLGGKGANLAEMASLGLPVPPGFTISTEVCTAYYANGRKLPDDLKPEVEAALRTIGDAVGAVFGGIDNPLLVSVRSGSRASMPGMMDTILNLGLNDATVKGLAQRAGDERFAYDSYRRFIQMYACVVLGIDHGVFEDILDNYKNLNGFAADTELGPEDWQEIIELYKEAVEREKGAPFPQDTSEQLWGAIAAVFGSWQNQRAVTYRRLHGIPEDWGTAVTVQAMVFGNHSERSATGVAFTRNPATGVREYGEFLVNAQGEDVVAGIRTPQPLTEAARLEGGATAASLEALMPETFAELCAVCAQLEAHYRDLQDIEFTIDDGRLWMLQTRSGKRTIEAAIRIAVDMAEEGLLSREEAVLRVEAGRSTSFCTPLSTPLPKRTSSRRACQLRRRGGGGDRVRRRRGGGPQGQGPPGHPRAHGDQSGGHPRHARRGGHPHRAWRHDESCGGCGARHGAAVHLRRRDAPHRRQGRDDDGRQGGVPRRRRHRSTATPARCCAAARRCASRSCPAPLLCS